MQFGRRDAGGIGDGFDFGLRAPIAADMGDGAAHDVVIGGRGLQPRRSGRRLAKVIVGSAVMVSIVIVIAAI